MRKLFFIFLFLIASFALLFSPFIIYAEEQKPTKNDNCEASRGNLARGVDEVPLTECEKTASEMRNLKFKKKVEYLHIDTEEVEQLINKRIDEEYPQDKLENMLLAYQKLGLIETAKNLREILIEMLIEQLAAFYDHKTHKLYLRKDLQLSQSLQEAVLTHELTHVLQDQNFNLSSLPIESKDNQDKALASISLIEGDATLVFSSYLVKYGKIALKDIFAFSLAGQEKFLQAPFVFRRNATFPYLEGLKFVEVLYDEEGWRGVDKAYKNPPQSTEQIIHPEKYLWEKDEPVEIKLPDLTEVLDDDWELIEDNVLGELNTRLLFRQFLGVFRAAKPSRGWDGDRFHVYKLKKENDLILVWQTVWDTTKDAEEFFHYYKKLIKRKYKKFKLLIKENAFYNICKSEEIVVFLGIEGINGLTIEAPDEKILGKLLKKFPQYKKPHNTR